MHTTHKYLHEVDPQAKTEPWPFEGHPWSGRDSTGYGRKIPTHHGVRLNGRRYRVYVMQYSNAGTAYIQTKRYGRLIIR